MYESFFGLSANPFRQTPDSRFFYGSAAHTRALAHLTFGIAQGEGFVIVTGEVGAGKTTLLERLRGGLGQEYAVCRIATTQLTGGELLRLTAAGFGAAAEGTDKAALLLELTAALARHRGAGRHCLLVVDEAQNLTRPALEELRMLSNLSDGGEAPLQTILLGQPEFRRMLAGAELDQLRQRVVASFHLDAMAEPETRAYVEHRLATVGWTGDPSFTPGAFAALHRHCGGLPRRINRLCGRVLLGASFDEVHSVSEAMVEQAAAELGADLDGVSAAVPKPQAPPEPPAPHDPQGSLAARVAQLEERLAAQDRLAEQAAASSEGRG